MSISKKSMLSKKQAHLPQSGATCRTQAPKTDTSAAYRRTCRTYAHQAPRIQAHPAPGAPKNRSTCCIKTGAPAAPRRLRRLETGAPAAKCGAILTRAACHKFLGVFKKKMISRGCLVTPYIQAKFFSVSFIDSIIVQN